MGILNIQCSCKLANKKHPIGLNPYLSSLRWWISLNSWKDDLRILTKYIAYKYEIVKE